MLARLCLIRENLRFYLGLAALALICMVWSVFAVPLNWLLPRAWKRSVGRRGIMVGFNLYIHVLQRLNCVQFDLRALDSLRHEQSLIIAPNHPSLLDAVMILSRMSNLACIMKAVIVDNFFMGSGARLARFIRNDSLQSMLRLAVEELRTGSHLLLFPEGTRSVHSPINPVQGTTGLIAKRAQASVQTVFIETSSGFLGKGWDLFRRPQMPVHYRIRLGKRFAPPSDVQAFNAELEAYFKAELQHAELPQYPITEHTQ